MYLLKTDLKFDLKKFQIGLMWCQSSNLWLNLTSYNCTQVTQLLFDKETTISRWMWNFSKSTFSKWLPFFVANLLKILLIRYDSTQKLTFFCRLCVLRTVIQKKYSRRVKIRQSQEQIGTQMKLCILIEKNVLFHVNNVPTKSDWLILLKSRSKVKFFLFSLCIAKKWRV